jgi:uncharacterized membrane protein YgcG
MADAKAKPASKNTKKVALYGVLGVGGLALAYWLYTKYQANAAANTTATTPADTTPAVGAPTSGPPTTSVPATTAPITTLAQWKAAILAYMVSNNIPGGENVAATGLADALSGHCVGPNEFSALNAALGSIGQPPGTAILTIKQCSASTKGTGGGQPGGGGTSSTGGGGSTSVAHPKPKPTKSQTNRANNAAAAARRRAQDLAAAARRRANNVAAAGKPRAPKPKKLPPQVTRATGVR